MVFFHRRFICFNGNCHRKFVEKRINHLKFDMMKRILFLFVYVALFTVSALAAPTRIVLDNKESGDIHDRPSPLYFDIPEAYYDDNPKAPEIIIIGGGAVSYYDVEITSAATNVVEISTQVNGTYDTFSVSSLTPGTHVITIESPSGNTYEGTFTTY